MNTNTKRLFIGTLTALLLAGPMAYAAGEPQNVTGVTATPVNSTSVGVSWNASTDSKGGLVNHYKVYYGKVSIQAAGSGSYENEIVTPNNTASYVVTGLTPATTYYFALTAFDGAGLESEAYSLEASATTPAAAATPPATPPAATTDTVAPTVSAVSAPDISHVKVVFSEAVKLPAVLPEVSFTIADQINPATTLDVKKAEMDATDAAGKTVVLETADQTKGTNYIITVGVAMTDTAGNPIVSGTQDSGLFVGTDTAVASATPPAAVAETAPVAAATVVEPPKDTTPPENITNLVLSFKAQMDKFMILMDWNASVNTAKDLVDQIVYMSLDRGASYDAGKSLGASVTHNELSDMIGGKEYTFKITTKDASGNESTGVVKSIRLPQTGVGVGIFLLASAGLSHLALRRKKKSEQF